MIALSNTFTVSALRYHRIKHTVLQTTDQYFIIKNNRLGDYKRVMAKKKKAQNSNTIALNKKAKFDYFLEEKFEAGVALTGWEVKSLRAGKAQLTDGYVLVKDGEVWLVGANITPMPEACTYVVTEPRRDRKLLLNAKEITKIQRGIDQSGHTCVPVALYWKKSLVKCEIALAKGKQDHDKRQTIKEREWNLNKRRILQQSQ